MRVQSRNFSKALITGGAGFIGHNLAKSLLDEGLQVVILDNFSRGLGCQYNIEVLKKHRNARNLKIQRGDVRNYDVVSHLAKDCDVIVHAAAQTSVPVSVREPQLNFETNVVGTFNVFEASRNSANSPAIIYISSSKVYGLSDIKPIELEMRYDFSDSLVNGVGEEYPAKPDDPYGLSKAVGEEFARIYSSVYGLKITSLRFGLVYGPGQYGTEEQGFVAWFCIAYALGYPIRIYGNGKQVRDILYIDDAVRAIKLAMRNINQVAGQVLNVGGGRDNSVSLLELVKYLDNISGKRVKITFEGWRPRDAKCFYINFKRVCEILKWRPKTKWEDGVKKTYIWATEKSSTLSNIYGSASG